MTFHFLNSEFMIKLFCTFILFAISALSSSASSPSGKHLIGIDTTRTLHSFSHGKLAAQLAVSDFYTLKNLQAIVNLKNHFSDNLALRIGLFIKFKFSKDESGNKSAYSGYGTNLLLQYYFVLNRNLRSYLVGGLQYEFEENDNLDAEQPDKLYSYGIVSGVGLEYFFISSMSLFTEFSAVLAYEIEKEKTESEYDSYGNVRLKDNSVSIGLSLYF